MYRTREAADSSPQLYFIVNPASHSGKGEQLWKRVERILVERCISYEVRFSGKRGDIARIVSQLTKDIPEGKERLLVMLGGDGTVNEAVQGIHDFERVRLGYIPTGSSNDLARDMGIARKVEDALDAVLLGQREVRMDLGCISWQEKERTHRRYFVVSCGMGYDAAVCVEALSSRMKAVFNKAGLGKLTYLGIGLKQMLAAKYAKMTVCLDGERTLQLNQLLFIAGMIHRYEGGGFQFCPDADWQDGLLELCVVNGVPKWKFPFIIPFALAGKHFRFRGVEHYRAKQVEICAARQNWVHTDGEIPGEMDRIRIEVMRQKLRFVF